jgi:hypothetical protein
MGPGRFKVLGATEELYSYLRVLFNALRLALAACPFISRCNGFMESSSSDRVELPAVFEDVPIDHLVHLIGIFRPVETVG